MEDPYTIKITISGAKAFGFLCTVLSFLVLVEIFSGVHWPGSYDDTDDAANKERSGLRLYIDHGTGVHYIKDRPFGRMIVRRDALGNIVTEEKNSD